jgi:hypothetical protein
MGRHREMIIVQSLSVWRARTETQSPQAGTVGPSTATFSVSNAPRMVTLPHPIESTFATVRHRTKVTKGPGSRAAGLAMAFKLIESAQALARSTHLTSSLSRPRRRPLRERETGRTTRRTHPIHHRLNDLYPQVLTIALPATRCELLLQPLLSEVSVTGPASRCADGVVLGSGSADAGEQCDHG